MVLSPSLVLDRQLVVNCFNGCRWHVFFTLGLVVWAIAASSIKMVLSPSLVLDRQLVVQPQLSLHAVLGDNCHPATSSRAAVSPDCLGNSLQNQILALFLGHIIPVCVVHHAIEV